MNDLHPVATDTMGKTRTATLKDVPAVIDVILSSVHSEHLWMNFVPSQRGRGTDFRQEIEALFEEHIDPSNNGWVIEVVDLGEKGGTPVIVSVAVWDMSAAQSHGGQSSKNPATPPTCNEKVIRGKMQSMRPRCPSRTRTSASSTT